MNQTTKLNELTNEEINECALKYLINKEKRRIKTNNYYHNNKESVNNIQRKYRKNNLSRINKKRRETSRQNRINKGLPVRRLIPLTQEEKKAQRRIKYRERVEREKQLKLITV